MNNFLPSTSNYYSNLSFEIFKVKFIPVELQLELNDMVSLSHS